MADSVLLQNLNEGKHLTDEAKRGFASIEIDKGKSLTGIDILGNIMIKRKKIS